MNNQDNEVQGYYNKKSFASFIFLTKKYEKRLQTPCISITDGLGRTKVAVSPPFLRLYIKVILNIYILCGSHRKEVKVDYNNLKDYMPNVIK
jgi:hypothetical protein